MTNATIAASFLDDFTYTYFGDARLTNRLCKVAAALACDPTATLPESCATEADVEGMYRLLNNERMTFDAILAPHHAATAARCGDYPVVRLIHDTTDVMFSGEKKRRGLGRINGNDQGFLLHVTLATTAGELPLPLGVAAVMPWIRQDEKTPPTPHGQSGRHGEFRRWEELAMLAEAQVPTSCLPIHIMDSEADAYALLAALSKSLFVIRAFRRDKTINLQNAECAPGGRGRRGGGVVR